MSSPLTVAALLQRNTTNLPTWTPIPTFAELGALGAEKPHIMVITCIDPRCIPEHFLHLGTGEVIVMRNRGGHATAATVEDIVSVDTILPLSDVVVIQHTDCGTTMYKDADVKEVLKERVRGLGLGGPREEAKIEGTFYGQRVGSIEESVARSVAFLKASPYVREGLKGGIRGMWFDLKSGALTPVQA